MSTKNTQTRQLKKRQREKRKAMIKSAFAILLVLLLIGMAVAPMFAQTYQSDYTRGGMIITSDAHIRLSGGGDQNAAVTEDHHAFIDFMLETIDQSYYKEVPKRTLIDGAYKGIFDALDPYSTYFTPEEYARFNTSVEGQFGGIGASITEGSRGYVEVVAPLRGTPAEAAGLMPGDRIVTIDGKDAAGFSTEQAVSLIRGEVGTKVILGIMRDGVSESFDVEIIRDLITVKSVEYDILEEGIGYIQLTNFNEQTNKEFDAAMAHMANNDIDKLILDVRNNPGGLLNVAIYVSDYFVPQGEEIVRISYRTGNDRVYRATRAKAPMDVAVLINRGAASASEILAGSIQAAGTGIIVGETTFGKGTVQNLIPLTNGGALKMTSAEYLLAGSKKVDGLGITPDVEVTMPRATGTLAPIVPVDGATTLNIYAAQQRLNVLGYELEADGKFGPVSRKKVRDFQLDYGIMVTGNLNRETLTAIEAAILQPADRQMQKAIKLLSK